MEQNEEITYRELHYNDYFKRLDHYNNEVKNLFSSIGRPEITTRAPFLVRQFASIVTDKSKTKRTHVFIAEKDGNMIGLVSVTNFGDGYLAYNLPCTPAQIFNLNFVATHKDYQNQGVATTLLRLVADEIFDNDDAQLLCYDPICKQSEVAMRKVFDNKKFIIHERTFDAEDYKKYGGSLIGFMIHKNPEFEETFEITT